MRSLGVRGSTTLVFAGVMIPVVMLLLSLSVDIESYFRAVHQAQELADDAVLYGYRFLPNTEVAQRQTESFLALRHSGAYTVTVGTDVLQVELKNDVRLSFVSYVGVNAAFPLTVRAAAQGVPKDVLILMDTASYLAPEIPGGVPLNDGNYLPAATYFVTANKSADDGILLDPLLVTQQCFNPHFSSIKRATIALYESLASFHLNAVGVGFFPRIGSSQDLARPVMSLDASANGEAFFRDFGGQAVSAHECFGAADQEQQTEEYQFPSPRFDYRGRWTRPEGAPPNRIDPSTGLFNPEYQPFLALSEAVWAQPVRPASLQDTSQTLEYVRNLLLGSPDLLARRALIGKTPKIAILIAGNLPKIGARDFASDPFVRTEIARVIQRLNADLQSSTANFSTSVVGRKAIIYYVLLRAGDLPSTDEEDDFAQFLLQQQTNNLSFRFIAASSSGEVAASIVRSIVVEGGGTLLAQ